MRRGPRPAGRAGFTLIELLTVIAILALLSALVVAGISRVRSGQQAKVTDQTLTKIQLALDKQWKAICDNCRDNRRSYSQPTKDANFVQMVGIADGDVDRAEALWMYLNLRKAMPRDFKDARNSFTLTSANGSSVTLAPSAAFGEVQKNTKAAGTVVTESAALLYMVVVGGSRGTSFALDDAMQGAQIQLDFGNGCVLPAFKDAYGNPIVYERFFNNAEIDSPPYARAGLTFKDSLDPVGRLALWKAPGTNTTSPTKTAAEAIVGVTFNGQNRLPTVISAGADKNLDVSGNTDDSFGYRLTRQGNKGD